MNFDYVSTPYMNSMTSSGMSGADAVVNQAASGNGLADTALSFLTPGNQAVADWKRNEQAANNAWLRSMYADSTKVQRSVEDMKKAGINPVLAVSGGMSGGSSGSAGTFEGTGSDNTVAKLLSGLVKLGIRSMLGNTSKSVVKAIGFGK